MSEERTTEEERLLTEAQAQGTGATLKTFVRLSGPGWLQSAITLGGGSLAGSLYLGIISGYRLLWVQILAMILGVIMLSAIGYVTLSTGERPFRSICKHINPVLGWGWLIAVLMANVVWSLPQFSLGTAALQQNLFPGIPTWACVGSIFALAATVIWFYDSGAKGIVWFERLLKAMVGLIVLCFFSVVAILAVKGDGLLDGMWSGFIPDLSMLSSAAPEYAPFLSASALKAWWEARIVSQQQDVIIAAAATAVGINMTFLLPYSMLRKGWGKAHRGLATFDLSTGLLIPFAIATSCVVVAASSQFHTKFDEELISDPAVAVENAAFLKNVDAVLVETLKSHEYELQSVHPSLRGDDVTDDEFQARVAGALTSLRAADLRLSAMLLKRDAFHLASALEPVAGRAASQTVFGIGVLGMAVSTAIILMLISGFAFCEAFGVEPRGTAHRAGAFVAGIIGMLGPYVWKGDAKLYLAIPTSNFGMMLLPIAYWTFFLMMNSKSLLGEYRPEGGKRIAWNLAMGIAASIATYASVVTVEKNLGAMGLGILGGFLGLALVVHFTRKKA